MEPKEALKILKEWKANKSQGELFREESGNDQRREQRRENREVRTETVVMAVAKGSNDPIHH